MSSEPLSVVVLDANGSWIRSLFNAMPDSMRVRSVRVQNPYEMIRAVRRPTEHASNGSTSHTAVVPGLRRFASLSQRLVTRTVRHLADAEPIDMLVCTNPWHAPAYEAVPAALKVYYVTDPFDYYAWPREQTIRLEDRVLAASDLVVATSIQLAEDFRTRGSVRVEHLPNAVSRSFVDALQQPLTAPEALADIDGPIVGAIGQMNDTYDWELIDGLSQRLPDVTFALVGPVMRSETSWDRFTALVERPNVRWLGWQPHESLPALLAAFSVCLNPLRKDRWNDRRSPLRLFDYSATAAPIVSTAIREVEYFNGQIEVVEDAEQGATLIRRLLDTPSVERDARVEWALANTWEQRAAQWVELVGELR